RVPDEDTDVYVGAGTAIAAISATATFSDLYSDIAKSKNLTISGSKVEIVNSASNILEVHGDLLIDTGGALDMNGGGATDGHIRLYGDWTNNAGNIAFDEGQGTVTFTGTTPQIISNVTPEGTETFGNLILNNNFDTSVSNNIIAKGNLTINTGKTLTITADDYAEVTNSVFNSGAFNILNDGSLIQVNDAAAPNTGSINYERKATVKLYDYVYWSSPTINFNMSGIVSHSRYYWDAQDPNANGSQGDWLPASGNMENGRGYIFRVPNSYATTSSPDNLTANFTGVPFNGIKNMEVKRGDLASATNSDWNLIGNPYPSAIDVVSTTGFLDYNTNLEGFVYVWTHGNSPFDAAYPNPFYQNYTYNYNPNDYTQINRTGNSVAPGDIKIAAGQGFFVQMTPGPATTAPHETVTFKNSFRSKNHANNQFYRMANNAGSDDERNRLWLDLNSTQTSTRILVGYVDGATNAFDRMYDASTEVKTAEQNFYSTLNNEIFKIQGKALPFNENDVVPLGVNITATGMHNIALANADGLFTGNQNIYLEDTQLGIIHDLRVNPYNFTAPLGVNNSRFILRYTNGTLSQDEIAEVSNSVFVVSNESLTISSLKESIKAIEIYDLLGRKLYQDQNVNSLSQTISSIQKTNSGLIIYITLENEKQVVKKAIY
ncbi:MAG: T9SS type A sorting domain-containing protein, partial [Crocinitomix sp.]|nr:T9SS type A sorting domain-containing protein [Crocinitomix sp.]